MSHTCINIPVLNSILVLESMADLWRPGMGGLKGMMVGTITEPAVILLFYGFLHGKGLFSYQYVMIIKLQYLYYSCVILIPDSTEKKNNLILMKRKTKSLINSRIRMVKWHTMVAHLGLIVILLYI